jgi:predicted ester cyclase
MAGPQGLIGWIPPTRAAVPDLRFAIEVGPPCRAATSRSGGVPKAVTPGIPGATAPAGTPVAFTGTDVPGVLEGKLAEYWVGSDMHVLSAQLQVTGG